MAETNSTLRGPVTALFSWTVDPGEKRVFEHMLHDILLVARTFPGHLGATTLKSPMKTGNYQTVLRFDSASHLNDWLNSTIRLEQLEPLEQIAHAETANEARGLETWFALPGPDAQATPRWLIAIAALITIYAINLLYFYYAAGHIASWPIPVRSLLVPAVASVALAYFLMPLFTQTNLKRRQTRNRRLAHTRVPLLGRH